MKTKTLEVDFGPETVWRPALLQMQAMRTTSAHGVGQEIRDRLIKANAAALRHCSQRQGRLFKEAQKSMAAADEKERLSTTPVASSPNRKGVVHFLGLGISAILRTLSREAKACHSK